MTMRFEGQGVSDAKVDEQRLKQVVAMQSILDGTYRPGVPVEPFKGPLKTRDEVFGALVSLASTGRLVCTSITTTDSSLENTEGVFFVNLTDEGEDRLPRFDFYTPKDWIGKSLGIDEGFPVYNRYLWSAATTEFTLSQVTVTSTHALSQAAKNALGLTVGTYYVLEQRGMEDQVMEVYVFTVAP